MLFFFRFSYMWLVCKQAIKDKLEQLPFEQHVKPCTAEIDLKTADKVR